MIGVYGKGGVGKTTLVKGVARQANNIYELIDVVVFACVSQTPDVKKIQGEIADKLGLEFCEESGSGNSGRAGYSNDLRKEKKFLIILDNIIWTHLDLEAVGIPCADDHEGCKLLLAARNEDVLSNEMDCQDNFLVDILEEEEAWILFEKKAGEGVENSDLERVAIEVAKACEGLPLALVQVARALRDQCEYCMGECLARFETHENTNPNTHIYT